MPAMLSTVSLIDPTTLNPSFSGPENSRMGRPAVIITRADQQTSVDQTQLLLTNAKAYRLQMLALSKAAANFGYALEKIAHSKAAVRDASNVSSSLQAAAGLHYLMSNHHQILSDTLYKQFEIPLLQHLDTHKNNIEASEAQYERSMRDMSQKIKETEAASMQNGRRRQRDLLQFRQALATLTMQVDELERIKLGYYFSNLESEQANLQLILQKTSTIVRAEVDIYERIASKGLNDSILEPMTTQGPDPYFIYPTTEEFSSIFSILPSTPIIPTTGAGATGTITPQPDAIMSSFYGYHENNPFSTARNLNNSTTRDRHLFGDASSIESKEESVLKKAATIVSIGQQHKPPALDSKSNATTVTTTTSTTSTTTTTTAASIATRKDTASASLSSNDQKRAGKGNQVQAIETISEESDKSASSSEKTRQAFGTRSDEGDDSSNSTAKQESKQSEESSGEATVTENQASTSHSTQNGHNETSTTRSSNGVDLQAGKQHHRNQTATSPSVSAPATPSEPASSVRSHSLRSRSGSRSHLLASTPDSPPVRGMIHIGQDSELLNNRDFSFSYEPSELLEQRNMHSQLNLSRHGAHNGLQPFAFHELEEEEGGFGATPPTRLMRTTHSSPSSQQHHPGHSHSQSNSPSASQTHSRNHSHHLQGLRHHSSDGQLSQSSSSVLSSVGSTHSGLSLHGTLQHRRSTGRIKTDLETAANMFDKSLDEPFLPSMTARGPTASEDRLREMRRGFDDGMPAFFPDEIDLPSQNSQPRSLHGFGSGSASGNASRRQSGFDQDMDKTFDTSPPSSVSNRPPSVVESIRMADGSSKNVSMTNVNEIAA